MAAAPRGAPPSSRLPAAAFGVSAYHLTNADELQIKISPGAARGGV